MGCFSTSVIATLSDAYKGTKDYENAIKYYEKYLNEVSKASASDHAGLGQLYVQHANNIEDAVEKLEKFKKADEVYANLLTKYTDIEDYVAFQRARIGMYMDPDSKQELAKHLRIQGFKRMYWFTVYPYNPKILRLFFPIFLGTFQNNPYLCRLIIVLVDETMEEMHLIKS